MDIEQALYNFLSGNTNIDNYFESVAPLKRNTPMPSLTYTFISKPRHMEIDVVRARVQLDIWADSYSGKQQGRQIVFDELNFWRGDMSGIKVKSMTIMSELENYDDDLDIYRQIMDFKIVYEE